MTVEAVYAASGDTVNTGDPLFKIAEESMEAAIVFVVGGILGSGLSLITALVVQYPGMRVELSVSGMAQKNTSEGEAGQNQQIVYVSSIEGNEVTFTQVEESVIIALQEGYHRDALDCRTYFP